MIVQLTRFVLVVAGALGGLKVTELIDWTEQIGFPEYLVIILFLILGSSIGYLVGGILGREFTRAYEGIEDSLKEHSAVDLALAGAGLFFGLLLALLVSTPFRMIEPRWLAFLATAVMFVLLGYVGIRMSLLKRHDVGSVLPRLTADPRVATKFLDTSVIIDGRFSELRKSGWLEGPVKVPGFVVSELHALSDSANDLKRSKGRRGLDLLATLKDHGVGIFEVDYPQIPETDGKLLKLALDTGGTLVTVDFNLTKVGRVQGLDVLNLNELASALKPGFVPGERLTVSVLKEGKEPGQGVGYLEDGTMVVVQGGKEHVGRDVDSEVTSMLQTAAGRMIFAKVRGA